MMAPDASATTEHLLSASARPEAAAVRAYLRDHPDPLLLRLDTVHLLCAVELLAKCCAGIATKCPVCGDAIDDVSQVVDHVAEHAKLALTDLTGTPTGKFIKAIHAAAAAKLPDACPEDFRAFLTKLP